MEFLCPPTKVWENDVIEFFIQTASDGTIWFHHNLKKPVSRSVVSQVYLALCEFFDVIKATFSVDKMYSWCPTPGVLKWSLYNGLCRGGTITINGEAFPIVEFE